MSDTKKDEKTRSESGVTRAEADVAGKSEDAKRKNEAGVPFTPAPTPDDVAQAERAFTAEEIAKEKRKQADAFREAEAEGREQRLEQSEESAKEGAKLAKKQEAETRAVERKTEKDAPKLNGTTLHFKGQSYDLKNYDAQQFREVNGAIVYEFLKGGMVADTVPIDGGVSQAHAIEAECNKYFRGY